MKITNKIMCIFIASMLVSCSALEDLFDEPIFALSSVDTLLDQGIIYVDDTGNIEVVINNLEFDTNPLFSEATFIAAWVYKRGGNARVRCCTGSSDCPQIEADSCIIGMSFSNELGFAGRSYLNLHPPRPFNRFTDAYYMPIYVSDKEGIPANYQGEYNHFSSPVNAVGDRELYTVYIGLYYSAFGTDGSFRFLNQSTSISKRDIYSPVKPDFLSPGIDIETRFYPQSHTDPAGSTYNIPHLASWVSNPGFNQGLFNRAALRINEIGSFINKTTENDFIEIYNPTNTTVPLEDVYLYRWTDTQCNSLSSGATKQNLTDFSIPPGGYLVLSRSSNTLGISNYFNSSIGNVAGDDCFALVLSNDNVDFSNSFNVVDFVGMSGSSNRYEGNGTAPGLPSANAISRCSDGIDTNNNASDFTRRHPTPGAANNCSAVAIQDLSEKALLLTEVHYDVDELKGFEGGGVPLCTEADDEFYEIYNASGSTVTLGGGTLQYGTSGGNFSIDFTFPNYLLGAGEYLVVMAQDAGCYTTASLSGRRVLFVGGSMGLNPNGATFVIVRDNTTLPGAQAGPAINVGTSLGVLDYVGTDSTNVYEGATWAPDCTNTSSIRTVPTTDTNENGADWSCGIANGTPGRAE